MARKALIYVLSDGTLMNISHREEWNRNSEFQKRVRPQKFMRVGLFAVTIGDAELAICAPDEYRSKPLNVEMDSPVPAGRTRDRLDQLVWIENALGIFGHPFEGLVRYEIEQERQQHARR